MARAPKKSAAGAVNVGDALDIDVNPRSVFVTPIEQILKRLWMLENALLRKQRAFIAEDGAPCCGRCYKPLGDVYESGCGIEYPEDQTDCQHRVT